MNARIYGIATAAWLAFAAVSGSALAQGAAPMDHSKMDMGKEASWTDGEIRKLDKENGKLTIKHGDIKHLDMPGMTMVFVAKDKAILDKVQVGDKIRFVVVSESGKMVVTNIQPAK